ncbi:MAG: MrtC family glutamic-type intramembrane protease [Myxococcales bacterium]|nr:MrtC family glutamic-type intramembrane protease [Myxococcales bacterium]MDH3484939.1 MrtC family glutamic-type intramembrane protease [Myxococcales bacterium]
MGHAQGPVRRILWVYVLVSAAVFGVTRLEDVPAIGQYAHLVVAAIFLLTSIRLGREEIRHFGLALGGLLEPPTDGRPRGPLGLWDLARALRAALPSAIVEFGVAAGVATVVFPLYAIGFYWWNEPAQPFSLALPPELASLGLAQLVVVALPEEAFFRGYIQTALSDTEQKRIRVLAVELAPAAWVAQAALFAIVHLIVEPHPARLAVFFPALLFGWLRAWRGGIGAAMALHAVSNLYSEILSRSWL